MIGKATVDLLDENTEIEAVREHVQSYTDESEFDEIVNTLDLLISTDLTREKVEEIVENADDESEMPLLDIEIEDGEEEQNIVDGLMSANEEVVEQLEKDKENEEVFGVAESMEMINEYFYKGSDKYSTEDMKELRDEYIEASEAELTLVIPL